MRFQKIVHVARALGALGIACSLAGVTSVASASSHREAPAIAEDQYADNTDVYTFISPEDPNRVVLVANYIPLLPPASGPNYYRFSDHVLYEIRVDNDGDAVADIAYEFSFTTHVANPDTFLYNTGAVTTIGDTDLNVSQTYSLTRRVLATGVGTVVAAAIPVAPWDAGRRSIPDYAPLTAGAIAVNGTTTSFAGPRQESFAVDFNVFDLLGLGPRAAASGGNPALTPNYATRYNVMTLAISVPITEVAHGGVRPTTGTTAQSLIGVYATASRPQVRILRRGATSAVAEHEGQWVQVSRLGLPLVNAVLINLRNKDNYNRTLPAGDAAAYGMTILNPSLNGLLIAVIPELGCTATPSTGNATLAAIITRNSTTAADLLRLNIATGETFATSGFPNGRRIADDVFTAEVNVICSGNPASPLTAGGIGGPAPTGITNTFPYLPPPIRPD
jgi:hypothetical protein